LVLTNDCDGSAPILSDLDDKDKQTFSDVYFKVTGQLGLFAIRW